MIHPIQVEADLLATNPKRPQLFLPRQKAAVTYNNEGRKFLGGVPSTPTSPNSLWNRCFLRSFTHRLASVVSEKMEAEKAETAEDIEKAETGSIDSFIDVVDLKPAADQAVLAEEFKKCQLQERNNNEEDDILPETFIQGPKSTSIPRGFNRRTSQKIERNLIKPLIQSCCTDIQENFKEFLRFDFSHTQNFSGQDVVLTPDSFTSKRIWTHGNDKPRSTLKNAICFKISSVIAKADLLAIKVDVANPSPKAMDLEVMIHLHVATEKHTGKLLYCEEQTVELPAECPEGEPFEFNVPLSAETRKQASSSEFLLLTMMGRARPSRVEVN